MRLSWRRQSFETPNGLRTFDILDRGHDQQPLHPTAISRSPNSHSTALRTKLEMEGLLGPIPIDTLEGRRGRSNRSGLTFGRANPKARVERLNRLGRHGLVRRLGKRASRGRQIAGLDRCRVSSDLANPRIGGCVRQSRWRGMARVQAASNCRGLACLAIAVVRLRVGVTVSALVTRTTFVATAAMTCPPSVVAVAVPGAEAHTHSIAARIATAMTFPAAVTAPTITAAAITAAASTAPTAIFRKSGIGMHPLEIHAKGRQGKHKGKRTGRQKRRDEQPALHDALSVNGMVRPCSCPVSP
jgi:hypothetical protein